MRSVGIFVALGVALLSSGCATRYLAPYTNTSRLLKVAPGMSYTDVFRTLEAPPTRSWRRTRSATT